MAFSDIRASSCQLAKTFGFEVPASLPLLEIDSTPRSTGEIVDRALTVLAIVAASYGFESDEALSWLAQESLTKCLSRQEEDFLKGAHQNRSQFQHQVESLCAFAWALGFLPKLDFSKHSPDHLVAIYPDLKTTAPAADFRDKARLRSARELVEACDAAYCLHWGLRQAMLDGIEPKRPLSSIVLTERRRALEWMLNKEAWDDISLDT